jgi:hypothetical protein
MKKATKEEDKTRRWCVWGGGGLVPPAAGAYRHDPVAGWFGGSTYRHLIRRSVANGRSIAISNDGWTAAAVGRDRGCLASGPRGGYPSRRFKRRLIGTYRPLRWR